MTGSVMVGKMKNSSQTGGLGAGLYDRKKKNRAVKTMALMAPRLVLSKQEQQT